MNSAISSQPSGQGPRRIVDRSRSTNFLNQTGVAALDTLVAPRYHSVLVAVLVAAAIVRILIVLFAGDVDPVSANIWETGGLAIVSLKYGILTACVSDPDNIAQCLKAADGSDAFLFQSAFVPPLPIFLFMTLFKFFGVTNLALATFLSLNVICGTAIVYYCSRIAETLFGSKAISIVTATIAAFHPVFAYSVASYHGVNQYLLLLMLLFDLCSSRFRLTAGRAIGIGIVFGVTILVRTEYLFLGCAILGGAFLAHRQVGLNILIVVIACCIVSPWTVRNYVVFHRFMPVVSTTGYALFKGFNPVANGSGHWVDANFIAKQMLGEKLAQVPRTPTYEVDLDDVYRKAATEFIAAHPARSFLELPARKFALFWTFDFYDPTTHALLYQIAFWPLFLTSLAGLIIAYRCGLLSQADHRTVLLLFMGQTVVIVGYAVHARYRMNVDPFLFAYSAAAICAASAKLIRNPARLIHE